MTIDVRMVAGRAELRALAEAATPRPWSHGGSVFDGERVTDDEWVWQGDHRGLADPEAPDTRICSASKADAAFIAAARDGVPELLDALDAAERERDEAREAIRVERTGLAHALVRVAEIAKSYDWIPAGESGTYTHEDDPRVWLREETGRALAAMRDVAHAALRESGRIVGAVFGNGPLFDGQPEDWKARAEAAEAALEVAREGLDRIAWVDPLGTPVPADYMQRVAREALSKLPPRRST